MEAKIKDKVIYFVSISLMCVLLISMAYFFFLRTIEVDVTSDLDIEYTGENRNASVEVQINGEDLNQRIQEFLDTVTFEVTPNTGLSNGDIITVSASYDEELANRYHFEVVHPTREIKVEGLNDRYDSLEQIDTDYLQRIMDAGNVYIQDRKEDIFMDNLVSDEAQEASLRNSTVEYAAFLKTKDAGSTDRVIQIYKLDYQQDDQLITLYYLVCVPEINDGMEVQTKDIFGERVYLNDQEIKDQGYEGYVKRVFQSQYSIETIFLTDEKIN